MEGGGGVEAWMEMERGQGHGQCVCVSERKTEYVQYVHLNEKESLLSHLKEQ